jgi:hypothetical protein
MIIYGIFVPFIFHLKRICYSFFCLRQYCDLLGYLFYQEYLQLIIPQYFISNKSGIWSLSLIVHSKG